MNRIAHVALSLTTLLFVTSHTAASAQKPLPPATPAAGQMVPLPNGAASDAAQPPAQPQPPQAPSDGPWRAPVPAGEPWAAPASNQAPAPAQVSSQQAQPAAQPAPAVAQPAPNPHRYAQTPEFVETPPEEPVEIQEGLPRRYVDQTIVAPYPATRVEIPLVGWAIANGPTIIRSSVRVSYSLSDIFQLQMEGLPLQWAPEVHSDLTFFRVRGDFRLTKGTFEVDLAPHFAHNGDVSTLGLSAHMRWHTGAMLIEAAPRLQGRFAWDQDNLRGSFGLTMRAAVQMGAPVALDVSMNGDVFLDDPRSVTIGLSVGLPISIRGEWFEFTVRPHFGLPFLSSSLPIRSTDIIETGCTVGMRFLPPAG